LRLSFKPALFSFACSLHLCLSLLALGFLTQGILPRLGRSFTTPLSLGLSLRGSLCLSLRLSLAMRLLFCGDLCLVLASLCSADYVLTRDDTFLDDITVSHRGAM